MFHNFMSVGLTEGKKTDHIGDNGDKGEWK